MQLTAEPYSILITFLFQFSLELIIVLLFTQFSTYLSPIQPQTLLCLNLLLISSNLLQILPIYSSHRYFSWYLLTNSYWDWMAVTGNRRIILHYHPSDFLGLYLTCISCFSYSIGSFLQFTSFLLSSSYNNCPRKETQQIKFFCVITSLQPSLIFNQQFSQILNTELEIIFP